MAPVTNSRVLFNDIPTGYPVPGKTTVYDESQQIDPETEPLNGGFLVKTLVLSIDPYMRGKMRSPEIQSYSPAYTLGKPIDGFGIGIVLRSEDPQYKKGDHVSGIFPFERYFVADKEGFEVLKNEHNIPWSLYIGAAGMPGKTAYAGWKEIGNAKPGEVVFVSGGAGPVGSFVIQLAKADGLKVIASAGSEEKVQFMKECGADVAFNYKTTNTRDVLAKEGPIDIYWDNVGGETLEAAIDAAAPAFARFIECGTISGYNGEEYPIKNIGKVVRNQIRMQGFVVFYIYDKYQDSFDAEIPKKLLSGELKYKEDLYHGLDKAGEAILAVQSGKNTGKAVVVVAEE